MTPRMTMNISFLMMRLKNLPVGLRPMGRGLNGSIYYTSLLFDFIEVTAFKDYGSMKLDYKVFTGL